jgi:hypothetical protein
LCKLCFLQLFQKEAAMKDRAPRLAGRLRPWLLALGLGFAIPALAADSALRIAEVGSWQALPYDRLLLDGDRLFATNPCAGGNPVPSDALDVYDLADAEGPLLIGSLETEECWQLLGRNGSHLHLFGRIQQGQGGDPGLRVVDVADPGAPELVAEFPTAEYWLAVVEGGIAYLLRYPDQLEIIDLRDPERPASLARYTVPGYASPADSSDWQSGSGPFTRMDVEQGRLYLIGPKGVRVINVADPKAPLLEGQSKVAAYIEGLQVSGGYAYVAEGAMGFEVLDVRKSDDIRPLGYLRLTALGVSVAGDYAWLANASGLHAVDVSKRASPLLLESHASKTIVNYAVDGGRVVLAEHPDRLTLLRPEPRLKVKLNGNGTVASEGGELSCGKGTCTGYLPLGGLVSLGATAATGNYFSGWGGDCSGNNTPLSLRVDRALDCTANFKKGKPPALTLKVKVKGKGRVSSTPAGISCPGDCKEKYAPGGAISLDAVPQAGWRFTGWSGGCAGGATPVTIELKAATTCTATFKRE